MLLSPDEKALIEAIHDENYESFNEYLKKLRNFEFTDHDGLSPLQIAAECRNTKMVKALLKKGVNPDFYNKKNEQKSRHSTARYTPLMTGAIEGDLKLVKVLIQNGADPNFSPPGEDKPIVLAAQNKNSAVVEFLSKHGADVNAQNQGSEIFYDLDCTPTLQAALHYAVIDPKVGTPQKQASYVKYVKYLVNEAKANIYLKDGRGRLPIHYAAEVDVVSIIVLFIERDIENRRNGVADLPEKNICNLQDAEGNTVLMIAQQYVSFSIVRKLLSKYNDLIDPTIRNAKNQTCIDVANEYQSETLKLYSCFSKRAEAPTASQESPKRARLG